MRSSRFDSPENHLDDPVAVTERQIRSLRRRAAAGLVALVLALFAAGALAWSARTMVAMSSEQDAARKALRDTLDVRTSAVLVQSSPAEIQQAVKQSADQILAQLPARMDQLSEKVDAVNRAVEADAAQVEGVKSKLVQLITAQQAISRTVNENTRRIALADTASAKADRVLERRLTTLEQRARPPQPSPAPNP